MALNLIDSNDIIITQTGQNIQLETSVDMQNVQTQSQTNATDINNLKSGEVYSTTEVKTNKVWIDGKPIYRQVIDVTDMFPNGITANIQATKKYVINNFGNLTKTRLVRVGINPLEFKSFKYIQYINDQNRTDINIQVGANGVGISSGQYFKLIFEYTKTTD